MLLRVGAVNIGYKFYVAINPPSYPDTVAIFWG